MTELIEQSTYICSHAWLPLLLDLLQERPLPTRQAVSTPSSPPTPNPQSSEHEPTCRQEVGLQLQSNHSPSHQAFSHHHRIRQGQSLDARTLARELDGTLVRLAATKQAWSSSKPSINQQFCNGHSLDARPLAGELDGALVRLSAGVAEEGLVRKAVLDQAAGKLNLVSWKGASGVVCDQYVSQCPHH